MILTVSHPTPFCRRFDSVIRQLNDKGHDAVIKIMSTPTLYKESPMDTYAIYVLFSTYVFLGKAFELLGQTADAVKWFGRIPEYEQVCWPERKHYRARQEEARLCLEGHVAVARLQNSSETATRALEVAKKASLLYDGRPGTHNEISALQQATGDLEGAKRTMNNALWKEAPWDKSNRLASIKAIVDIHDQERRIEERRILEQIFVEKWGPTIDAAEESRLNGDLVSWESGTLHGPMIHAGCTRD